MKFKLPYWISNNGDGSASIHPMATLKEAEFEDENQSEGWGEGCAGELELKVEDGKLYFSDYQYVGEGKKRKYTQVWIAVGAKRQRTEDEDGDIAWVE